MSKIDSVCNHLQRYRSITSWEAINLYKATRLADIIYKLKDQGFDIETLLIKNNSTRFAMYQFRGMK